MFTEGEPEFCSAEHKTSYLSMLMRIDRRFMGKCFGQMQELGIYPGQIPVLGLLAYKDGLSQREIAEKLRIKPPTVNVTVQRLEKAGFLCKKLEENEIILLDGFKDTELCLLRRFLEQITENIEKIPVSSGKNNTEKEGQQK